MLALYFECIMRKQDAYSLTLLFVVRIWVSHLNILGISIFMKITKFPGLDFHLYAPDKWKKSRNLSASRGSHADPPILATTRLSMIIFFVKPSRSICIYRNTSSKYLVILYVLKAVVIMVEVQLATTVSEEYVSRNQDYESSFISQIGDSKS